MQSAACDLPAQGSASMRWAASLPSALQSPHPEVLSSPLSDILEAKTSMSYSHTMHRSRAACCCQVSEESGSLSLFTRGLDVTLIGSVPSIAVYFGAYQFF